MTWTEIRETWPALIASLQTRFPELDEDGLVSISGEREELVALLEARSARDRVEAERDLEAWREGPMPSDAYADPSHDNAAVSDAGRYVPEGEDALADDRRFGDDDLPDRPMGRRET
jgi:hypothetical protein